MTVRPATKSTTKSTEGAEGGKDGAPRGGQQRLVLAKVLDRGALPRMQSRCSERLPLLPLSPAAPP